MDWLKFADSMDEILERRKRVMWAEIIKFAFRVACMFAAFYLIRTEFGDKAYAVWIAIILMSWAMEEKS